MYIKSPKDIFYPLSACVLYVLPSGSDYFHVVVWFKRDSEGKGIRFSALLVRRMLVLVGTLPTLRKQSMKFKWQKNPQSDV